MRSLTIDRYPPPLGKVCKLVEMTDRQSDWLFKRTEVTDIWGVGRRIDKQLKAGGHRHRAGLEEPGPRHGEAQLVGGAGAHGA